MHPRLRLLFRGLLILAPLGCGAQTLYDFGNPTADEQMYIELINRARNDPSGEGERLATTTDPDVRFARNYAKVNLTTLRNEFNALTPLMPPLVPNAKLMTIARQHSGWMRDNGIQSHTQSNNPGWVTYANRLSSIGYTYNGAADNVYAYAKSPWHGHAGFEIDWRGDNSGLDGGMQNPRGHRDNIHDLSPIYREIGVGVTYGGINGVGPSQV
ncbi:MAG TPA: CAP domain-containing protein, partial [Luteolibacter sp.]|nr:CAP domain-containing protein [Luteolibacter sp.]